MGKPRQKEEVANTTSPGVPAVAVPHLFNQLQLDWLRTNYEALKEIYGVLERIEKVLKE